MLMRPECGCCATMVRVHFCIAPQQWSTIWVLLPDDVPFVLECLNAPDNEIINMYDKLDDYFEQFDIDARFNELKSHLKILTEEKFSSFARKSASTDSTNEYRT